MRVTEGVRVTKRTRISTRIKTNLFVLADKIWNFYLSVWSIWTDFNGFFILSADRGRWHSRGQRFDPAYLHHQLRKTTGFPEFFFCKLLFLLRFSRLYKPVRNRAVCETFGTRVTTRIRMTLQGPDADAHFHHF